MANTLHNTVQLTASHLHALFTKLDKTGNEHDFVHTTNYHYGILPAHLLLEDPVIKHIQKQLSVIAASHYEEHYAPLITAFAEMVQGLPIRDGGYVGSLLKSSLCHAFFSVLVAYDVRHETADPLLLFSIFSATILQDIAAIKTAQLVLCCDEEGNTIKQWNPFAGPLSSVSNFYRFITYPVESNFHHKELTLLLAKHIMPAHSFVWISDDDEMFSEWIDTLINKPVDEWETRGGISNIIYFIRRRNNKRGYYADNLKPVKIPHKSNLKWQPVFDLLNWLAAGFSGAMPNDNSQSWCHVTEAGVFLEFPFLFDEFIGRYARAVDAIVFVNLCNAMGIIKMGGHDYKYDQFFSSLPKALIEHLSCVEINGQPKVGVLLTKSELVLPANYQTVNHKISFNPKPIAG